MKEAAAGLYISCSDTLPLGKKRSGTKLENTSLSTGVFQQSSQDIYNPAATLFIITDIVKEGIFNLDK